MHTNQVVKIKWIKILPFLAFILLSMLPLRFIIDEKADSYVGLILFVFSIFLIALRVNNIIPNSQHFRFLIIFYLFTITTTLAYFGYTDADQFNFNEIFRLSYILFLAIALSAIKYEKFIINNFDRFFILCGIFFLVFTLVYNKVVLDINFIEILKREEFTFIQEKFKFKGLGSGTMFAFILLLLSNLSFLNLLFVQKNKIISIALIFFIWLVMLSTIQRGILLQALFSIVILAKLSKINFSKRLLYMFLGFLIISSSLYFFWEDYFYRIFIEPVVSPETFWSGRWLSIQFALNSIKDFDIFEILSGTGTNRINLILEANNLEMLHNDYLMLFYNYGIIGLIFWIAFLLSILITSLQFGRSDDHNIKKLSIISTIFILNLILASLHTNMIHEYKGFILTLLPFLILLSHHFKLKKHRKYVVFNA